MIIGKKYIILFALTVLILLMPIVNAEITNDTIAYFAYDNKSVQSVGYRLFTDSSGNNYNIEGYSVLSNGLYKLGNDSVQINGNVQRIELNNNSYESELSSSQDFGISLWVYPTEDVGSTQVLVSNSDGGNNRFSLHYRDRAIMSTMYSGVFTYANYSNLLTLDSWNHVILNYDGSTLRLYVNGELTNGSSSTQYNSGTASFSSMAGYDGASWGEEFKGNTDELFIRKTPFNATERERLYNDADGYNPYTTNTYELNITQTPSDINTSSFNGVNISVEVDTVADYYSMNNSVSTFYYAFNSSIVNGCVKFENNSCTQRTNTYLNKTMTKINNTYFEVYNSDTELFPAYYPFIANTIVEQVKSYDVIYNSNSVKFNINNFSTDTSDDLYLAVEMNVINLTSLSPLNIYYCNSTYTTGNPQNLNHCGLVQSYTYGDFQRHTHGSNSEHVTIPINPEVDRTKTSYIILRSNTPSASGWKIAYITNSSYYGGAFENGQETGWSSTNNIYDMHVHQFLDTDSFLYKISFDPANSDDNTTSDIQTDAYDVVNIAPFGITIFNPCNDTYTLNSTNISIFFNWSEATDRDGDSYTQYINVTTVTGITYFVTSLPNGTTTYDYSVSYLLPSTYKTVIRLTDSEGNSELSTSECSFSVCQNDYIINYTSCVNGEKTRFYTDSNECPLQYDFPDDNGTIEGCVVYSQADEEKKEFNVLLVLFIFLVILLVLGFVFNWLFLLLASLLTLFITYQLYVFVDSLVFAVLSLLFGILLGIMTIFKYNKLG